VEIFGKICRSCKKFKPVTELKRDTRYADSYSSFCKDCHKEHSIAWQKRNPEKVKAANKKRYHKNKNEINQKRRLKYDGEKIRWFNLKRFYKVDQEWYNEQLRKQNNKCAICKIDANEYGKNFVVDHNHSCCKKPPTCGNCNRGLLCNYCNLSLSSLEFKKDWIEKAKEYLNENSKNS